MLLRRQQGLELPPDDTIDAKFLKLAHVENSIGRTGMLAIDPLLEFNSRDLWHLNALEGEARHG